MDVRLSGKETDTKEEAETKAQASMEMRPSGSVMETKETQPSKAAF